MTTQLQTRQQQTPIYDSEAEKVSLLHQLPVFAGINDEEGFKALASVLTLRHYTHGQTILDDGTPGHNLYFLTSGEVEFYLINAVGTIVSLGGMRSGIFGEVAVLTNGDRTAHARVARDRDAFILEGAWDVIEPILLKHPELLLALTRVIAHRLGRTSPHIRRSTGRTFESLNEEPRSAFEKSIHWIAGRFISLGFLIFIFLLTIIWFSLNGWPKGTPLDPYPYNFLALILSLIASIATSFVLLSQEIEARKNKKREEAIAQASLNAEIGIHHLSERLGKIESRFKQSTEEPGDARKT